MKNKMIQGVIIAVVAFLSFLIGGNSTLFQHGNNFDTTYVELEPIIEYDTTVVIDSIVLENIKWKTTIQSDTIVEYRDTGKVIFINHKETKEVAPFAVRFFDSSNVFVNIYGDFYYPQGQFDFYYINKYVPERWYGRFYATGGLIGLKPGVGMTWCNRKILIGFLYGDKRVGVSFGYKLF